VVGCGGDDDEGSAATTTTVDSAAAPTETQEEQSDPAADERIAEEAGLVLEDFPTAGSRTTSRRIESPRNARVSRRPARRPLPACPPLDFFTERAHSRRVWSASRGRVGGERGVRRSGRSRDEDMPWRGDRTARRGSGGGGSRVRRTDDQPGRHRPPPGDERDATRITIPVSAQGIDVDIIADYVLVRVGRGIAAVTFVDTLTAFDEDLKAELMSKVVRRLSAALD
jgi:hypothetical protein